MDLGDSTLGTTFRELMMKSEKEQVAQNEKSEYSVYTNQGGTFEGVFVSNIAMRSRQN